MSARFSTDLIRWYRKNARDLPWRRTRDPYKIWISEVMLQQTTVNAVIPYYHRWIKIFPDVQSVARAPVDKILKLWQGLGYYQRARNLHRSAQLVVKKHSGRIPTDPMILRAFPGFGPYTVGAVLSIAFDQREAIIDANVRRVVMRIKGIRGQALPDKDKKILSFLDTVMPRQHNDLFNQAMMELGALICRSLDPLCAKCPVKNFCSAFQNDLQTIIPKPKVQKLEDITVAVAVIRRGEKFFIQKRGERGLLAGLWEFPGGKIEKGETARQALEREIMEELNGRITQARHLMRIRHAYTRFRVILDVWSCQVAPIPQPDFTHRWVTLKGITRYPLPTATVKIIQKLEDKT